MFEIVKSVAWFLAGASSDVGAGAADASTPTAPGIPTTAIVLILVFLGLVIVGLHVFIAVWMGRQAARAGRSAAGWAIFGAIPIVGLIGLFIFALLPPAGSWCRKHRQLIPRGQPHCPQCEIERLQVQAAEQQRKIDELEHRAPAATQVAESGQPSPIPVTDPAATLPPPERVRRGPMLALMQVSGLRAGTVFPVPTRDAMNNPTKEEIGRDAACCVRVPEDQYVSRRHASIREENGRFVVRDLDSEGGTFVRRGSEEIAVHRTASGVPLHSGDIIRVGQTEFQVIIHVPGKPPQDGGACRVSP